MTGENVAHRKPESPQKTASRTHEYDPFGRGRFPVGVRTIQGIDATRNHRVFPCEVWYPAAAHHAGQAEHDVTDRTRPALTQAPFRQQATFGQVFWAVREWLVASAIGERLTVQQPFAERLEAGKVELSARLTSGASVGVSTKVQRSLLTNRMSTSVMLQAAFKTVR
jgi:hypothetical protein